jgi:hypothetical protein
VPRAELDGDHPAQAVADDDRLLDPDLRAEPRNIVGEARDLVAVGWRVAVAAPAQGERRHGVGALEVVELRREERVVAAPPRNEEQLELSPARAQRPASVIR